MRSFPQYILFNKMLHYKIKRILLEAYVQDERTKQGFKKEFGHNQLTAIVALAHQFAFFYK